MHPRVHRAMMKLGRDMALARRVRSLSTIDMAERMGVTVKTLANQRSAGTGPKFVKVGGSVRYPVIPG